MPRASPPRARMARGLKGERVHGIGKRGAMVRLGAKLRSLREERGLTQAAAAVRAGQRAVQIALAESGSANATIAAMACAYEVEVAVPFATERGQVPQATATHARWLQVAG